MNAICQLIQPSAGLASCVRGYVSRSPEHGVASTPPPVSTHLPAALTCAISWFIDGKPSAGAASCGSAQQAVIFHGPRTQAQVSEARGTGQSFMVLLMPDALRAMAGLDIATYVNRASNLSEAFDAAWHRMAQAVLDAPNDALRVQLVEEFLEPRWRAARAQGQQQIRRYQDWVQELVDRAQNVGVGRSMRQAQRRIKEWAGLSLRQMQGIARIESALAQVKECIAKGQLDWSRIAFESGFSDQAHFCREIRRVFGMSPTELRRAVNEDEGFWLYRLLH